MEKIDEIIFTHLTAMDLINKEITINDRKRHITIEDYDNRIKLFEKYLSDMNIIGNFIFGLVEVEDEYSINISEVVIVIFTTIYNKLYLRINNAKRKRGIMKCNQK